MPTAFRGLPAFSRARYELLASCRKPRSAQPPPSINAARPRPSGYSTIAAAMLGRAVQEFHPPPKKEKSGGHNLSSGPRGSIEEILKPRLSQQSIGGFAGVMNKAGSSYDGSGKPYFNSKLTSISAAPSTATSRGQALAIDDTNVGRKRTVSEMKSGLVAALQRAGSFQDSPNTIDLTKDEAKFPAHPPQPQPQFEIDPDEFDNDSDIDIDIEYPTALPPTSTRKPLRNVSPNATQFSVPTLPAPSSTSKSQPLPSSAIPWSSSPLTHKTNPSGPTRDSTAIFLEPPSSDIQPPAPKRRTLPWNRRQAEDAAQRAKLEKDDESSSQAYGALMDAGRCFECGNDDHQVKDCKKRASKKVTSTPLKKETSYDPWNTTASAVKQNSKALREQNKMRQKPQQDMSASEIQQVVQKSTTKKSRPAPMFLSDEQKKVLSLVCSNNKSVFFTGSAGTGKSVLMRSIIGDLRTKYAREPDRVAVTASTGLAACNIGGVTLHSFSGIGLGKEPVTELVKKITRNQKAKNRWIKTKVLIIDEISMVDGDLFDKLEEIARRIRKNGRPFGGIQLVITGDFFQLPPVPDYGRQAKFAFDASTWTTSIDHTIGLTEVFRQRDPVFANMLNEMRLGKISDQTIKNFRKLDRPLENQLIEATELFPTRNEVDNANSFKMRSLMGKSFVFKADDSGTIKDVSQRDKLLSNCMAPQVLELKKGSQVMLIKNMDDNLVNGSLGKVVAFMDEKSFLHYDEGNEVNFDQESDTESKSGLNKFQSKINPHLIGSTSRLWPLVRFSIADGTVRELLCQPEDWKIELPNGEIQAQRRQIPLILAWALSIHKAQGQTLERVTVDLKKVFENGQAYVALSRATTQEGLQVKNFNKKAVMAHPRVAQFYDGLYSVNKALMHPTLAAQPNPVDTQAIQKSKPAKDLESDMHDHSNWEYDDEEEMMAMYG